MEPLINKKDIADFFPIAQGAAVQEINCYVIEAQDFDLKPLLGEDFYHDMVARREQALFKELIGGGIYTVNGVKRTFEGLRKPLAYFTYARFILKHPVVSTSYGFVIKKTPSSEALSLEERRNFYNQYIKDANTCFETVKTYLNFKQTAFPLWKNRDTLNNFFIRVIQ